MDHNYFSSMEVTNIQHFSTSVEEICITQIATILQLNKVPWYPLRSGNSFLGDHQAIVAIIKIS